MLMGSRWLITVRAQREKKEGNVFCSRMEREKMTDSDNERWMRRDGERKASNINQVHTGSRRVRNEWERSDAKDRWVDGWMDGGMKNALSSPPRSLSSFCIPSAFPLNQEARAGLDYQGFRLCCRRIYHHLRIFETSLFGECKYTHVTRCLLIPYWPVWVSNNQVLQVKEGGFRLTWSLWAPAVVERSGSSCSRGVRLHAPKGSITSKISQEDEWEPQQSHKLQRRNRGGGEHEASGELLSWRDDPEKSGVWNGLPGKEVYSAGRRGGEFSSCSCADGGPGAAGRIQQ